MIKIEAESELSFAEWVAIGGEELAKEFEAIVDKVYGRSKTSDADEDPLRASSRGPRPAL